MHVLVYVLGALVFLALVGGGTFLFNSFKRLEERQRKFENRLKKHFERDLSNMVVMIDGLASVSRRIERRVSHIEKRVEIPEEEICA